MNSLPTSRPFSSSGQGESFPLRATPYPEGVNFSVFSKSATGVDLPLYDHEEREPEKSVNFVTCHDGFTLNDLVSYDNKHKEGLRFHLILNTYWEALEFELPPLPNVGGSPWRRWIDTALESPNDIVEWQNSPSIAGSVYRAEPCSVSVFFAGTE